MMPQSVPLTMTHLSHLPDDVLTREIKTLAGKVYEQGHFKLGSQAMPPKSPSAAKPWKEVDQTDERLAVCPWCGYAHVDSCEFRDSCDAECERCEKPIHVVRHVTVIYTTTKGSQR